MDGPTYILEIQNAHVYTCTVLTPIWYMHLANLLLKSVCIATMTMFTMLQKGIYAL